jgi:amino acid transporter
MNKSEYDEDSNNSNVIKQDVEYTPPKSIQTWLIGRPLQTADAPHQTIGKLVGLAVFASDALSSTAYATQEMLLILAAAGAGAFHYSINLSIAIVVLLTILTISYEQTIHAYPTGGGAYIVARDNLGELPAQIAGAALLTDYILTVAVSISSGVAQIVSAFPTAYDYRVWIASSLVIFIMLVNLRGVKESGSIFAIPTYFFVVMMYVTVAVGLFRYIFGTLGVVSSPPEIEMLQSLQPITFFLILKAFSSGTTAVTGVEAISNGITAFKEPRSSNAGKTLIAMSVILGSLLVGITFISVQIHAVPSEAETVISQIARTVWGSRGILYIAAIAATTVILVMAANTAFADFPRLSALIAADGFLPRQLTYRGSRLVFSRGIMALAGVAILLIMIFQASVSRLIPLYAIGVFLSFTLSQAGMAHRWWKSGHLEEGTSIKEPGSILHHDPHWTVKMVINGLGSVTTGIVMMVFAITKFRDGAWIVVILTPSMVLTFYAIHRHYVKIAKKLSLEKFGSPPRIVRHRVILPISGVHQGTLAALRYARTLSDDITAVHVSIDSAEAERVKSKWQTWGDGLRLVILESPYRLMVEPLLQYIESISATMQPNEIITIVVPQFVPKHWWANALHTQTAIILRMALLFKPGIVITDVPYQVD